MLNNKRKTVPEQTLGEYNGDDSRLNMIQHVADHEMDDVLKAVMTEENASDPDPTHMNRNPNSDYIDMGMEKITNDVDGLKGNGSQFSLNLVPTKRAYEGKNRKLAGLSSLSQTRSNLKAHKMLSKIVSNASSLNMSNFGGPQQSSP
jgi:hypothetical protein